MKVNCSIRIAQQPTIKFVALSMRISNVVIILTEWSAFTVPPFTKLYNTRQLLKQLSVIILFGGNDDK